MAVLVQAFQAEAKTWLSGLAGRLQARNGLQFERDAIQRFQHAEIQSAVRLQAEGYAAWLKEASNKGSIKPFRKMMLFCFGPTITYLWRIGLLCAGNTGLTFGGSQHSHAAVNPFKHSFSAAFHPKCL